MRRLGIALLLGGCNQIYGLDKTEPLDARACNAGADFGPAMRVDIDPFYSVEAARFTRTRGIAYLSLCPNANKDQCDLYLSPYSPATETFSGFSKMTGVSAAGVYDAYPTITNDLRYLLFGSGRDGSIHIFVAMVVNSSFDTPIITTLPGTNASANEPYIAGESGRVLYFAQSQQVHRMEGDPPTFGGAPVAVAGLNVPGQDEFAPVVRDSELEIFFASGAGGIANLDIYQAARDSTGVPFGTPAKISLSTSGIDWPVYISPNGCDLYFISKTNNVATLYVAKR